MIACSCGQVFDKDVNWYIHYHIGKPTRLRTSRLLPWLTQEIVDKRDKEIAAYDKMHSIVSGR